MVDPKKTKTTTNNYPTKVNSDERNHIRRISCYTF